ncbi:MAG: DUF881 domain-containing protein [Stackebrandtia sp.]
MRTAASRVRGSLRMRRRGGDRRWKVVGALTLFAAGVLFSATGSVAGGTSLRDDDPELREVIPLRNEEVQELGETADELRDEADGLTDDLGSDDADIAAEQERAEELLEAVGLTEVHGPGLVVALEDAPRLDGNLPGGASGDDVVVHQQDVQAVVNALWAGGAEAMTIMDVRVIGTSAVRCVGNTLLLHGQVYSPPFVIAAIGDGEAMSRALDDSDGVRAFRAAAEDFGLGYSVNERDDILMPAYDGPVSLIEAEAPR